MGERAAVRVVLDTNVVISALIRRSSSIAQLRDLWHEQRIVPLASTDTTKEFLRVLAYPKFRLDAAEQRELVEDFLPYVSTVAVPRISNQLARLPTCRDADDDKFLQLAQSGNAEILVTGDKDLLALNDRWLRRMTFEILTPADALVRWTI